MCDSATGTAARSTAAAPAASAALPRVSMRRSVTAVAAPSVVAHCTCRRVRRSTDAPICVTARQQWQRAQRRLPRCSASRSLARVMRDSTTAVAVLFGRCPPAASAALPRAPMHMCGSTTAVAACPAAAASSCVSSSAVRAPVWHRDAGGGALNGGRSLAAPAASAAPPLVPMRGIAMAV